MEVFEMCYNELCKISHALRIDRIWKMVCKITLKKLDSFPKRNKLKV